MNYDSKIIFNEDWSPPPEVEMEIVKAELLDRKLYWQDFARMHDEIIDKNRQAGNTKENKSTG